MQRPARKIDAVSVLSATTRAAEWREETVKRAVGLLTDHDKAARLEKAECVTCYYVNTGRIGGAAITEQPCGICGKEQSFCNTCTDPLCLECAKAHELCKRCGADIKLRPRRNFQL